MRHGRWLCHKAGLRKPSPSTEKRWTSAPASERKVMRGLPFLSFSFVRRAGVLRTLKMGSSLIFLLVLQGESARGLFFQGPELSGLCWLAFG